LGEELGERTRVSAGNPSLCSDSAVKLSALAGRIGGAIPVSHLQVLACDFEKICWRRLSFEAVVAIPGRWALYFNIGLTSPLLRPNFLVGKSWQTLWTSYCSKGAIYDRVKGDLSRED
jgi:hypothetical protein